MAYCNWCQLESDSEDACVWCKRPLVRSYSIYGGRSAVSLLREDNDTRGDRIVGIVGLGVALLFISVVVYAAVSYANRQPSASAQIPTVPAGTVSNWSGERAPAAAETSFSIAPPPQARQVAPSKPASAVQHPTSTQPPAQDSLNSFTGVPAATAVRDGESPAKSEGVYIESAKLSSSRQGDGRYSIAGLVYVANVSGNRIDKLTFELIVGDQHIPLKSPPIDLGNGGSAGFEVKAVDVDPRLATSSDARIQVSATTAGGVLTASLALSER